MERIDSRLLGQQYYDDTPRAFVAPPITERKALMQAKEDDYLLSKKTQNAIETLKRQLPSTLSPDVYNRVVSNIDTALSGITPENYSDKVLDVEQVANDMQNVWGGNELVAEQKAVGDMQAHYDEAVKSGKIESPEFANFYKQRDMARRVPLRVDEKGFVSKPNVPIGGYAEYVDMQKMLDERMKGWESDGTIKRNQDGTVSVLRDIPGYLAHGKDTFITEAELMRAGMNYLKNDEKTQAYLNDKTEFGTRNIPPTAANLDAIMSPKVKEAIFGNPNATVEDVQSAIDSGKLDPNAAIKGIYKENQILNHALFTADKYGYNKEEITTLKDDLLIESLKAQQKINDDVAKARATAAAGATDSNMVIAVAPFMTQQVLNPTEIKAIQVGKKALATDRTTIQRQINSYKKAIADQVTYNAKNPNNPRTNYSEEQLEELNRKIAGVDAQIAQIEEQEKSLHNVARDNFAKAGFDLDKEYRTQKDEARKEVISSNLKDLVSLSRNSTTPSTIDVTDLVNFKDGKATLKTGGTPIALNHIAIKQEGGKLILDLNKSTESTQTLEFLKQVSPSLFEEDGSPSARVNISDSSKEKLKLVPDEKKYYEMIINAYNDGTDPTNMIGMNKTNFTSEDGKYILPKRTLDIVKATRDKQGDFEWTLGTPLSYLHVTDANKGDAAKKYLTLNKSLNQRFKETPERFSVRTLEGTQQLGQYLSENFGLPKDTAMSDEFVDWEKTHALMLLERDRQYGQKYGMKIILTKAGREELSAEGEKAYANTNGIKLVGVDVEKAVGNKEAEIADALLKTYPSVQLGSTAHEQNIQKEMGILYINQAQEGRKLDEMNLYTMAAGESRVWEVRGTDYEIRTTAKDGEKSDLMNLNYHLGKPDGTVFAMNDKGEKGWYNAKTVEQDKTLHKVTFDSPTDIKAVVGKTLLEADVIKRRGEMAAGANIQPAANAFANIGQYYRTVNGDGFTIKNYGKTVKAVTSAYEGPGFTISTPNNTTGKVETIQSRVPLTDLYSINAEFPDRVSKDTNYPLVHKNAAPYVKSILADTNVTITGGFRGEKTHGGLNESSNDSLHKYGYGLDLRSDAEGKAFKASLEKDPKLMEKYGIINIREHGNPVHIHLEFAPTTL